MGKVRLDELVEQQTSKIVANKNPEMPYIGLEHIAQGEPRLLGAASSASSTSVNSVFRKDDILFGKLRPNLKKSIRAPFEGYCSTDILVLRSRDGILPSFTGHVFQWERVFAAAVATAAGTKMPRTAWSDLRLFRVCKPSTEADQARIAYVLDTIDGAIQKTEAVIAKLKKIRAGMLHDLLTYGLDKDGKLRDPIAHPEQFKDSELGRIPKEWEVFSLKDIGQIVSGGTPSRANPSYWNGDLPWITPTDMTALRGDYIAGGAEYISEQGLTSSAAVLVPARAVVVTSRATLGLAAVVSKPLATNQGFKNIIPHEEWNCVFICHIARRLKTRMVQQASGTTFLEISAGEFGRLKFAAPDPDSKEQATIVERIESVDCTIISYTETQEKLSSLKSGLMDDLLIGKVSVPADLLPEEVS
jgi:type I restriction enzyme, S subunit